MEKVGVINGIDFDRRLYLAKLQVRALINRRYEQILYNDRAKGIIELYQQTGAMIYEGAINRLVYLDEIALWPRHSQPFPQHGAPKRKGTKEQDLDGDV